MKYRNYIVYADPKNDKSVEILIYKEKTKMKVGEILRPKCCLKVSMKNRRNSKMGKR